MIYIEDLTVQQLAEPIKRLCRLCDIQTNGNGAEFVEFIKYNFARYDAEIITKALDSWMAGNYPEIRSVKTLTMPFITSILNRYIDNNRHRIKMKPAKMLQAPEQKQSEFDKEAFISKYIEVAKSILNGEHHNYIFVSPLSHCAELLQLPNTDCFSMIELIENHNKALDEKTRVNIGENKFRQFAKSIDNKGSIIKAGLFLDYVNRTK